MGSASPVSHRSRTCSARENMWHLEKTSYSTWASLIFSFFLSSLRICQYYPHCSASRPDTPFPLEIFVLLGFLVLATSTRSEDVYSCVVNPVNCGDYALEPGNTSTISGTRTMRSTRHKQRQQGRPTGIARTPVREGVLDPSMS